MKLLILGGTRHLGRHTVGAAHARGHELTLFHRGRTNPNLFPELEHVYGDREQDLSPLRGRRWDAVIDPSGFLPRVVRASCDVLREAVDHYIFISSIGVYADPTQAVVETDVVAELPAGAAEVLTGDSYGPLKALCEKEVEAAFPGHSAIVRAGLIYGPHDPSDRSGYWPVRVSEGGEVLAPGPPERPVQLIDVRDLATWLVELCERRIDGVFNATGPNDPLTMGRFLETCRDVTRSDASFTWIGEEFLLEQGVGPYSEMPLWVRERFLAFGAANRTRAMAAGLRSRPLAETIRATLDWMRTAPPDRQPKGGVVIPPAMTRDREAELLRLWHVRAVTR